MSSLPSVAGMGDEPEEVSILEKVLKILIVLLFLSVLYTFVEPVISEIAANAQRDRVTGDFNVISDAINRCRLQTGKSYTDTSLAGLVEKKFLKEMPRDPWGGEYVYSWFFDQLVCSGANRELDTFVPGLHDEATEPDNDDRLKNVTPLTRLVFAVNGAGSAQIVRGDIDGFGITSVEDVAGEIQSLSVLPGSKQIVYSIKRGAAYDLQAYDWGTRERIDLTGDAFQDLSPVWSSPKCDQIVFQSDRGQPGGPHALWSLQLPGKTFQELVKNVGEEAAPASSVAERRVVFFASKKSERPAIFSFTLPDTTPVELVSGRGNLMRPMPSPNGLYLAYLVQEAQVTAIEVIELKTKKQLFRKEGASPRSWIAWSPDGDMVAYQAEDKGQGRIVLAHPQLGRSFVHPSFVLAFARFAWVK